MGLLCVFLFYLFFSNHDMKQVKKPPGSELICRDRYRDRMTQTYEREKELLIMKHLSPKVCGKICIYPGILNIT